MNSDIDTRDLTEDEMNESSAQLGLVAAAVATGLAVSYVTVKIMNWNERRKAKNEAAEALWN